MGFASFGLSLLRGREASVNIRRVVKRFTFGFDGSLLFLLEPLLVCFFCLNETFFDNKYRIGRTLTFRIFSRRKNERQFEIAFEPILVRVNLLNFINISKSYLFHLKS